MQNRKNALRRLALSRRDSMSAEIRQHISRELAQHAQALFPAATSETVSAFWPIRSEIDPRPLMAALERRGASLALPAVAEGHDMVFRCYVYGDQLAAMDFGTYGPMAQSPIVEPTTILLPLAAFDDRGSRIGYGGGFYDRAIAALHQRGRFPRLIGLGFDCQQVAAVPVEPHDVALNAVVTESGVRWFA